MSDETDALIALRDQENARVIHYQEERTNTTNIIFVIVGVLIALICVDQKICGSVDGILALILIPLGLLGIFLNAKYHERIYSHEKNLKRFEKQLISLLPNAFLSPAKSNPPPTKATKGSRIVEFFYHRKLWKIWVTVNAITVVIGIVLFIVANSNPCA